MHTLVSSVLKSLAIAVALSAAPSMASAKSDISPADMAALKGYTLDAGKVNKYIAATDALAKAKKADKSIGAEMEASENEPDKTFADLKAKLTRHPKIFGYYQKQGLTADDTVLLPLAMMYGAIGAQYNTPEINAMVNPAQTAFMKAHPELGQKLTDATKQLDDDQDDR